MFLTYFVLVILVSACQPQTPGSGLDTPSSATATATQGSSMDFTSTEIVTSTQDAMEEGTPVDVAIELGPGSFLLIDPRAGLADLSSYTATLNVSFDGNQAGQAKHTTSTYTLWHTKEPFASQLTIARTPDNATADPTFLAEVADMTYEIRAEGMCQVAALDPGSDRQTSPIYLLEPASLLKSVFGAEEAGQENVNGIPAMHYIFDHRSLLETGISEAHGEIWVAPGSGVVLRYLLNMTADADYFGEGIQGTMVLDYALTDIATTLQPALPLECQLDVPLLADASAVSHLPFWLSYNSSATFSAAAAFYQQQLPEAGWVSLMEPLVSETSTFMEFSRRNQTIGVLITMEETSTLVNIVLYHPGQ